MLLKMKSIQDNMNQDCIDHPQVPDELANLMNPK